MALTITNKFSFNTVTDADKVNTDFADIATYLNASIDTGTTHNSDVALLPKGRMAYKQATVFQGGIDTEVDVDGLSITFTALANRYYRITGFTTLVAESVVGIRVDLKITDGSNTQLARVGMDCGTAGAGVGVEATVQLITQPGAGSKTYKLRALRAGAAGTLALNDADSAPGFILAEDIGL